MSVSLFHDRHVANNTANICLSWQGLDLFSVTSISVVQVLKQKGKYILVLRSVSQTFSLALFLL